MEKGIVTGGRSKGSPWYEPDVASRPVLVVGTMRSGTTLLNRVLNSHPDVGMVFTQTDFWRAHFGRYDPLEPPQYRAIVQDVRLRWHQAETPFPEEAEQRILDLLTDLGREARYADVYRALITTLVGREVLRWGEKYAGRCLEVPRFLSAFPRGQVIQIHRDPRDVYLSEKRRLERLNRAAHDRGDHLINLYNWVVSARLARHYRRTLPPESYLEVKYDELVTNPERTVRSVCAFLGISFHQIMLDLERYTGKTGEPWTANSSFEDGVRTLRGDFAGRWRDLLDPSEMRTIEQWCGAEMDALGYRRSTGWRLRLAPVDAGGRKAHDTPLSSTMAEVVRRYRDHPAYRSFPGTEVYKRLSVLRDIPLTARVRGIVICGVGALAHLCALAVRDMGFPVRAFVSPATRMPYPSWWSGIPVIPVSWLAGMEPAPAAIVVADVRCSRNLPPGGVEGTEWRVDVDPQGVRDASPAWSLDNGPTATSGRGVLTPACDGMDTALPRRAGIRCRAKGAASGGGSFEVWRGTLPPKGWELFGTEVQVDTIPSDLVPGSWACRLTTHDGLGGLVQSLCVPKPPRGLSVGFWVQTRNPGTARILVAGGGTDAVSDVHPGDGEWRFLSVSLEVASRSVQIYLQLSGKSSAVFDEGTASICETALPSCWPWLR